MSAKDSLEAILSECQFSSSNADRDKKSDPTIGFKIPAVCKKKYDDLQSRSDRKFAETLKKVVIASIEISYKKEFESLDQ